MEKPLAIKLRPNSLSECLGQKHLIGENKILSNLVKNKNTHTTEAISIWNLAYIEDDIYKLVHNPLTEKELISKWLDTKIDVVNGSMGLYARYCPVCKSHHIEISDNELEYQCMNCHSIYTFFEGKKENEIWFLRVRRA